MNLITRGLNWPLPNIEEMLAKLGGKKYFSILDLTSGYHQMMLTLEASKLTAFKTSRGIYRFNRVPFGLKGAPSFFQKAMVTEVLQGLQGDILEVYIDDIIVWAMSPEEMVKRLGIVFQRMLEYNVKINFKKCKFNLQEIPFLGHIISGETMKMSDERKENLKNVQKPRVVTEMRSFLGIANYFRKFIKLGNTFTILSNLIKGKKSKQAKLNWSAEADEAFSDLKERITNSAPLFFMIDQGQLILYCDASVLCCGGVLCQLQNGREVPLYYYSHTFSDTEKNWSTTDQEMFSVIFGIRKLHPYIAARNILVRSDHAAICFNNRESISKKVQRWKAEILELDLQFIHIKGIDNGVADSLSRNFTVESRLEMEFSDLMLMDSPFDFKEEIMKCHNLKDGHWGISKTLGILKERNIHWKNMRKSVKEVIDHCTECQRNKAKRPVGPGQKFNLSSTEHGIALAMDTKEIGMDPLGFRYIIVMIDCFSRYVYLYPTKSTLGIEAAMILSNHFLREGSPKTLKSDNGRQFINEDVKKVLVEHGIMSDDITPYSSQENGMAERAIKSVEEQLNIMRELLPEEPWSNLVSRVMNVMNKVVHSTTGCAPSDIRFGQFNRLRAPEDSDSRLEQSVYHKRASLEITKLKEAIPKFVDLKTLKIDDFITIRDDERTKTGEDRRRNLGPYQVTNIVGNTIHYGSNRFQREYKTHVSNVFRYYPKEGEDPAQTELGDSGFYVINQITDHKPNPVPPNTRIGQIKVCIEYAECEPTWYTLTTETAKTIAFCNYAASRPDLTRYVKVRMI